jgi:single-stranded-DNA-specific exonuclease
LEDASLGADLLMQSCPTTAQSQAMQLNLLNQERREIEKEILAQAEEKIAAGESGSHSIVLADSRWNEGVIGICCSRLVEKYHLPTILIALDGECGKGSCRSISGFDLFKNLQQCESFLTKFGGHEMAAGLGIQSENVAAFADYFNALVASTLSEEDLAPKSYYDAELSVAEVTENVVQSLQRLEPHGMANPSPVFAIYSAKASLVTQIGADKSHLKFVVEQDGYTVTAIAFQMGHLAETISDQYVDLLFSPGLNDFRGNTTLQLEIKSIRLAHPM